MREPAFRPEFRDFRFGFGFPGQGPVFWVLRQTDLFNPEFDAGGECDGFLAARERESAGGGADLAAYDDNCWNDAEGFKLFFLSLRS